MRPLLLLLPLLVLAAGPAEKKNFKEFGSPSAKLTMEIYTDYQCPSCRAFYMEVMPEFNKEFVNTGRVRVVHRDFPLPMHQYGGLAAKYANAAGRIGKYELVANQIFRTQPEWSKDGKVEAQVAKVLTPAELQKVHEAVKSDRTLDETTAADVAMATKDRVNETPTLEIVQKGNRQQIGGYVAYPILKRYIEQLLAKG